ncbi:hypothetical protein TRFO_14700 [Tritrichomonas foetus]|uniref:Inner membrane component domain-containing protein n=1 Tax=Tritrichomonas foetus TaxID=1144522 RepID=A0A1J4KUF1_9EUKA|nr:hypothetical protein TRFO_14700 [Tritrichomonas foetus]|eukprot:OHT14905.1 hypothetical protein TRFO_14700 [Tritrichomonas foetus]
MAREPAKIINKLTNLTSDVLGNIMICIYLLLGGFLLPLVYLSTAVFSLGTLLGIPYGIQYLRLAFFAFWPDENYLTKETPQWEDLTIMSFIWFILALPALAIHYFFGFVFYITIIGIPIARIHFRMARVALYPCIYTPSHFRILFDRDMVFGNFNKKGKSSRYRRSHHHKHESDSETDYSNYSSSTTPTPVVNKRKSKPRKH